MKTAPLPTAITILSRDRFEVDYQLEGRLYYLAREWEMFKPLAREVEGTRKYWQERGDWETDYQTELPDVDELTEAELKQVIADNHEGALDYLTELPFELEEKAAANPAYLPYLPEPEAVMV